MERAGAPAFSCIDCWYRSEYAHRVDGEGLPVFYCLHDPPYRGQNMEGRQRWHRTEVTHRLFCGQFTDRETGETYEMRWLRWIEEKKSEV
jgi:hypothetical protein